MSETKELWMQDSPALTAEKPRYSSYPIKYPKLLQRFKDQQKVTWTAWEVSFKDDINHVKGNLCKTPESTRRGIHALLYIMGFFLFADGLLLLGVGNLANIITIREVIEWYALTAYIEVVHGQFYSESMESIFPGQREKIESEISSYPGIKRKIEWTEKWIHNPRYSMTRSDSFSVRPSAQQLVVANAIIESIFFTPSFGIILHFKKNGKMTGFAHGNDMISRDENMHRGVGCDIYELVEPEYRLPADVVSAMIQDAVSAEKQFVREMMSDGNIDDFTLKDACTYVEYIADLLSIDLGYPKIYKVSNPFPWIAMMNIENKSNFFETRVGDYVDTVGENKKDTINYGDDLEF